MATVNFLATTTDDSILAQWWIEIEGIRRRIGTESPSWAPVADTGTNRIVREFMIGIPGIDGQKVQPLNGKTEHPEFTVDLLDVDDELTELFSVLDSSTRIESQVTAAITAAGLVLTVEDSSVFSLPCDIFVDRETMRATNDPTGTTLTVTRGMYGSLAVEHKILDEQGNALDVFAGTTPYYMITREILLCENRAGLLEVDTIRMRCTIEDIDESDPGVWTIRGAGFLRQLKRKIATTLAVSPLISALWGGGMDSDEDGSSPVGDSVIGNAVVAGTAFTTWCIYPQDTTNFTDPDVSGVPGFVIIDEEVIKYLDKNATVLEMVAGTLYGIFEHVLIGDGRGLFAREILGDRYTDFIPGTGHRKWASVWMADHPVGAEVKEIIHSEQFTQGTGPASVILTLLTSTGDGTNGTYDVLPKKGWGAGIPQARVDITGIEDICSMADLSSVTLGPFAITEPVELLEWLEKNVLRPCNLFFVETTEGVITVKRIYTLNEAAAYSTPAVIDEDVMTEMPRLQTGPPPMGEFTWKMNWHPGRDEFLGKVRVILGAGLARYEEMARKFELEIKTVYDPNVGEGYKTWQSSDPGDLPGVLAPYMTNLFWNHAENPLPRIVVTVPYNRLADYQVGQVVQLTASSIPNLKASVRGLSSVYCQVFEAHPLPEDSTLELVLWMIDAHDTDTRLLAAAAKVKAYAAAGGVGGKPRITLYPSTFADGIHYTYDVEGFATDDFIDMIDDEYIALDGAGNPEVAEIIGTHSGAGANDCWIDIDAVPADPPGDGDYVTVSRYDSCVAAQKAAWAFLADANGDLGVAPDAATRRGK